jgi:GT2 family glycosyltransferase
MQLATSTLSAPSLPSPSARTHGIAADSPPLAQTAPLNIESDAVVPQFDRIRVHGKGFRQGASAWYVKGLTYGPFAPNSRGAFLPERWRMLEDFAQIRRLGANSIRLYHPPTVQVLDDALENDLHVLIDVPWQKHRCFLDEPDAQADAIERVRTAARELGNHPAVFAISVANEIPKDIVRYHGPHRVERFLEILLATVKEQAPQCLATYTNYPSTEFLLPRGLDFYAANVYLEDTAVLGRYLDRLQLVAGKLPLVLGEFGIDTIRHGEGGQTIGLEGHVRQVFRRGLAGSFVFSFTDDWYTGGWQITDWAFGITDRQRREKPSSKKLTEIWSAVPEVVDEAEQPKVSVVVCAYNAASTLDECLSSLLKLNYRDCEIILVDDGSTDGTPAIAARYPQIVSIRQPNRGLSAARNAGLQAATGAIVAYTDADCAADENWLLHLVRAMRDQNVDAVGGPNEPPASDGPVAQAVAASPGGPTHVLLDDCQAEHVPGCNMAFRRSTLLGIGGFDPQFRAAGDDVDICWRWRDEGLTIGFASAALVWHHRRSSVRAYFKQQAGYGSAEAMLQRKHPQRFNALGASRWAGVVYGNAGESSQQKKSIFHGQFGLGLFQIVYRDNRLSGWTFPTLLEWHALAVLFLVAALFCRPLLLVPGAMWCTTLVTAIRAGRRADLPGAAPAWSRPMVGMLSVMQPIVRAAARYGYRAACDRPNMLAVRRAQLAACVRSAGFNQRDVFWHSHEFLGREEFLSALVEKATRSQWVGTFADEWASHDVQLLGDLWHDIRISTATEEMGWPKRFTRARIQLISSWTMRAAPIVLAVMIGLSAALRSEWMLAVALAVSAAIGLWIYLSRRRCLSDVSRLVYRAGVHAKLWPVPMKKPEQQPRPVAEPAEDPAGSMVRAE